tara:strand:- start:1593 stop:2291 length:699 start_codon:yes stop_codon:yes gene_type:complete
MKPMENMYVPLSVMWRGHDKGKIHLMKFPYGMEVEFSASGFLLRGGHRRAVFTCGFREVAKHMKTVTAASRVQLDSALKHTREWIDREAKLIAENPMRIRGMMNPDEAGCYRPERRFCRDYDLEITKQHPSLKGVVKWIGQPLTPIGLTDQPNSLTEKEAYLIANEGDTVEPQFTDTTEGNNSVPRGYYWLRQGYLNLEQKRAVLKQVLKDLPQVTGVEIGGLPPLPAPIQL